MPDTTHEHTINDALGEVLQRLRPNAWSVRSEELKTLVGTAARPDILIEEPAGWPVVIEAEKANRPAAERDALDRLNRVVSASQRQIESVVALIYPQSLHDLSGTALTAEIMRTGGFEYALYSSTLSGAAERLPESGWLSGDIRSLALLLHRASTPPARVERLSGILNEGIEAAAAAFTHQHPERADRSVGDRLGRILRQGDDQAGQTRRMAMTVIANALIFHAALAAADLQVDEDGGRAVRPLDAFVIESGIFDLAALPNEWRAILRVNYWPIFASALELLREMPAVTEGRVLNALWQPILSLVQSGVTRSHDLIGLIFQRLIADREFLAPYYTRPAAAALLAGIAVPAGRPPRGADWGDAADIGALQIGDFACGTGTLLGAAYQRVSLLHEFEGGEPADLHRRLMRDGLVGLDVLNIAVHFTATMLAAAHPAVPFEGDCLLTMPYGAWNNGGNDIAIGSLDLLDEHVKPDMLDYAAAVTAGGRRPEQIRDLATRVGHSRFDLVIMNPPYASPTNPEAQGDAAKVPPFAAFETAPEQQAAMSKRASAFARADGACAHGNAGLASNFMDLADAKVRPGGAVALVLPLSALSGQSWEATRRRWCERYSNIVIVTIAAAGARSRAFSADTAIAECLFIGWRADPPPGQLAAFATLHELPRNANAAALLAEQITNAAAEPRNGFAAYSRSTLQLGDTVMGHVLFGELPEEGPWSVAGILDPELPHFALRLANGELTHLGRTDLAPISVPMIKIQEIGERGPVDRDIKADAQGGTLRGPFLLHKPPHVPVPAIPILWGHSAVRERGLIVEPDSEGEIRRVGDAGQEKINRDAERVAATASRIHFSRDTNFNSHSLIVAVTERPTIGGQAWPTVSMHDEAHEHAFTLWCNSTLGLVMYWWLANKRQNGRGNVSISKIPSVPALDTRALTGEQHAVAARIFDDLKSRRFLPFDQIDEDPARHELDRRLLVDVLGLDESLVAPGGTIDLLRRKLAAEPQIHGGKRRRVVFTDEGERNEPREDR